MSTFPDGVFEYGGKPAGGRPLAMWPSETVWFVDYDNGSAGGGGRKPSEAFKYLDTALSSALHGDVIYIRPRAPEAGTSPYYGADPGDITPQVAATNWTIAYTQYGLSLIGTGTGIGAGGQSQTNLQGGTTAGTPVLSINAPYVSIENLGFKPGTSTTGLIYQRFADNSANQAYANSYYRVWFRNVDAQAGYSLGINSGMYDTVQSCIFSGHGVGLYLTTANNRIKAITVRDCDFDTIATAAKAHISCIGGIDRAVFDQLRMLDTIPTGGAPNLYISVSVASTGLFSNSYLGAADPTIGTNTTLNSIKYAGIWVTNGLPMVDA